LFLSNIDHTSIARDVVTVNNACHISSLAFCVDTEYNQSSQINAKVEMVEMRGKTPDWQPHEFERLAQLCLQMVRDGYLLEDAFRKFEEETNHVRSRSAIRYKWVTKLAKQYAKEYEAAKAEGEKKRAERIAQERQQAQEQSQGVPRMTKRELIRWLRQIEIVSEDDDRLRVENQRLRAELEAATKERDELRNKYLLLKKQYDELKSEADRVFEAFNIVRQRMAGVERTSMRVVVGPDGVVQSVREDGR
jgi:chromosome segregation ATPase